MRLRRPPFGRTHRSDGSDPLPSAARSPLMTGTIRQRLLVPAGRLLGHGIVAAAIAVAATGCSPAFLLNALVSDEGYTTRTGLAYGSGPRQRLDVYMPDGPHDAPRPIVVFFYGGSWKSGDRDMYAFLGEALTSLGYITVVPDYTLYPEARFPEFVEDGAQAVAWVRERASDFGGDADRLIIAGHSAGAHIAMLLLLDERYLDAVDVPRSSLRAGVGISGPYAFNPLQYDSTRPVFSTVDNPEVTQPVSYVDGDIPPLLLLHGADDTTVRPANSRALAEAARARGRDVRLEIYPETGHAEILLAFSRLFRGDAEVLDDVTAFLRREL